MPFRSFSVLLRPENLSHREDLTKGYSSLCERRTPERKSSPAGRNPRIPSRRNHAIAIVIKRDIISIIIIIISTIYTAITTAAPQSSVSSACRFSASLLLPLCRRRARAAASPTTMPPHRRSASGYRGVRARPSGRFDTEIRSGEERIRLGTFGMAHEAARA
ncbi:hypothetical protein QYE76_064479 [Lolium multiflorum]|uniref:AP2/ERF domain-containing protein n=1 Tax=Lolium multiflorum TaxID=4521 RepID=A0AAD8S7H2_LOLMU|nr:hypothetical protein QYE76_064479 [Lolium multiflorum]